MKKGRGRKGQLKLSFGMIFSIFLIIIFLAFAFYAIKVFLGFQNSAKAGKFVSDLQSDVNRVWQSTQASELEEYPVPSGVDYVCFIDFSSDSRGENSVFYSEIKNGVDYINSNFAFYPVKYQEDWSGKIKNIDIQATTSEENPLCISVNNGKASLYLKRDYGEAQVTIAKK